MHSVAVMMLLAMWSCISPLSHAGAQPSPLRQSAGSTGTTTPPGDDKAMYSDVQGNKDPTHFGSRLPSQAFSGSHGATPGTVTPFGTPTPPNLLTPAPLLPLQPKGMATPHPQAPAAPRTPGPFGPSNGRPGR